MRIQIRSVVLPIIALNIIFFIIQQFSPAFTASFLLVSRDILTRPWILITSMFLHANFIHIFFNMYVLFMFGPLLEQRIGPWRFLFIYLVSGIVAAILSSFFYSSALGASGAIMGIIGVLIILMPNLQLLLFFVIPMPLWFAAIIIAVIEFIGVLFPTNVANIAHLVGLGCGLLYGWYLKDKMKVYVKKFSKKTHLEDDDIDEYLKMGRI
jgi:uncharacterized protein